MKFNESLDFQDDERMILPQQASLHRFFPAESHLEMSAVPQRCASTPMQAKLLDIVCRACKTNKLHRKYVHNSRTCGEFCTTNAIQCTICMSQVELPQIKN